MMSVDWLESLWQSSTNPNDFTGLCGGNLNSVKEETYEKGVDKPSSGGAPEVDMRDASSSRSPPSMNFFAERDYCEDDDSSIVSSSGISLLSIDYNNDDINGLAQEKVDLSYIGDDESTVASEDSRQYNDAQDFTVMKENLMKNSSKIVSSRPSSAISRVGSNMSISRNRSNISMKSKRIETICVDGNPVAEQQRKNLLVELQKTIATHGRYSLPVAKVVVRLAQFHETVDQHEMSVTLNLEALGIFSSKLGDSDSSVTETQVRLGQLKEKLGDSDAALDFYYRALSMITAMTGIYEENASKVRVYVARIYQEKGFFKESIRDLKKSLRGYRNIYGDEHILVADTVDIIADVYSAGGNHDKANSVRGELVKLRVALHGNKSAEVAHAISKWAGTYVALEDFLGALKVMKQAYVMFHELEGPDGPNTELSLEQIGILYSETGRDEKAIKAHTSVAVMRKARFGEDSVEVAESYFMLGKAFLASNLNDKALKSFNRAMTIFGRENVDKNEYINNVMDTLHQIGLVHKQNGKSSQALKAFTKELSIRRDLISNDQAGLGATFEALGSTFFATKKYEPAYKNYLEALRVYDKVDGRRFEFAMLLVAIGGVLDKKSSFASASKCYLEALQILKANGYDDEDEAFKQILEKIPHIVGSSEVEPSVSCSLIDSTSTRSKSERFEV
mmetsp:Transcript_6308/g.7995  ORF Transcript_6308/g.7995 Transcript_6308/m.7995 type:complete len:678 (-) Transcript_6308:84-2117(-)